MKVLVIAPMRSSRAHPPRSVPNERRLLAADDVLEPLQHLGGAHVVFFFGWRSVLDTKARHGQTESERETDALDQHAS